MFAFFRKILGLQPAVNLDINKDGKVDAQDVKAAVAAAATFMPKLDINEDGKIDKEDVKVAVKAATAGAKAGVAKAKSTAKKTVTKAKRTTKAVKK